MFTNSSSGNIKQKLLYLLPISLLLGTNFPILNIGNRTVYLGTNELVIFLLLILFIYESLNDRIRLKFPKRIVWGVSLFSMAIIYSATINILTRQNFGSLTSYIEIVRWFEYLFVFFVVLIYVRTVDQVSVIFKIMYYCLLISILYSTYQAATFNFSEQRIYGLFVSGADRSDESISNPNVVGALFMGSSLFFLSFSLRRKFAKRKYIRLLLIPSIAVLVLTLSRSAVLGFFIGAMILMLGYRKQMVVSIVSALIIIGTLIALVSGMEDVSSRITDSINLSSDTAAAVAIIDRWSAWNIVLAKLPENMWFGVGYGDFENGFGFLTPDNQYIEFLATTGVVGIAAFAIMLYSILYTVIKFDSKGNDFLHALKFGYLGTFSGFLVANITGGLFGNPRLLGIFWLLTAIVIGAFQLVRIEATSPNMKIE